jgi:hypothetical protein
MSSSAAAAPLDFSTLLSREYRPARIAQLIPKEKLKLSSSGGPSTTEDDGPDHNKKKASRKHHAARNNLLIHQQQSQHHHEHSLLDDITAEPGDRMTEQEREEEAGRLALKLVSQTPAYTRHLERTNQEEEGTFPPSSSSSSTIMDPELAKYFSKKTNVSSSPEVPSVPGVKASLFHQVELDNWEDKILWEGYSADKKKATTTEETSLDPEALLQVKRNPYLESMNFEDLVSWSGDKKDTLEKASKIPLLLELGVAGQSVARHALPSHRPLPYVKSDAYMNRMEKDWGEELTAADVSKGSLHADKDKLERLIAQRQEKRRQMAKDKTSRVTEAMGTLDVLAGGRGRTITSSLMGPGGTERTGRPTKTTASTTQETEYIEQLDMVTNHSLYRDLTKAQLRQLHRPKLPLTVVQTSLKWQFQIRYIPTSKKGPPQDNAANSSSYQAMMMGTQPGSLAKAKLRTESDLSPTEGKLVLLEYSEERPPIQLSKGMSSKIVTYYRGDKSRCPVSAGGGDRPTRRKRAGDNADEKTTVVEAKLERPPRLVGPSRALASTITEWVGKPPKKSRDDRNRNEPSVNILPEGVTEILHPKVHGPFIGEIEEGQSQTGLISNLFVAPLFSHEPESTDFLLILGRNAGATIPGRPDSLGVVLRELPKSIYAVGQTEPRQRVFGPGTQGEKNFIGPFVSYMIAKALTRHEARDDHGLRFDEIQSMVLPNLGLTGLTIRNRLKYVAIHEKDSGVWSCKSIGQEDYPGVDALGKQIPPEGVATFQATSSAVRRLSDLGIHSLMNGAHALGSVGVAMIYLAGQLTTAKEIARKVKKLAEVSKSNKNLQPSQVKFYEEAALQLEKQSKALRQKHEVAKFIYEELQLAPWHLTGEFLDVHRKGEGTGMMKLTGLGDPTGVGEGFSFLREVEKTSKVVGSAANQQTAQMKKITGTEDDLRKLTMKQMGRILRSYGMPQQKIDTLKRWDRVHIIRDLSTKAASDGIGDGLERFARGEKMKLSEQKQMYRDRIKVIWKRMIAALSDSSDKQGVDNEGPEDIEESAARSLQKNKDDDMKGDDSDSESSEDDDFAAEMEEEMMDRSETNQLVAAQAGGDASLGQLRNAAQDKDLSKDARELAALKRQREEERAANAGLSTLGPAETFNTNLNLNRKVVRKKITKTYPDGRQTTTFKFIVHPQEVQQTMARLKDKKFSAAKLDRPDYPPDKKIVGHAMFEDDDDFEFSNRGRGSSTKRKGRGGRGRSPKVDPFARAKSRITKGKKRMREEDEDEVYEAIARRKGTSNRKERGSARERKPHVVMANRLEAIRGMVESRPSSTPFLKPVNSRAVPRYYEVISEPIDLSTIRKKIEG